MGRKADELRREELSRPSQYRTGIARRRLQAEREALAIDWADDGDSRWEEDYSAAVERGLGDSEAVDEADSKRRDREGF